MTSQLVRGLPSDRYLSHLFDFGASFPNKGATLAGWDHQPQGDGGLAGGWAVAHGVDDVLQMTFRSSMSTIWG